MNEKSELSLEDWEKNAPKDLATLLNQELVSRDVLLEILVRARATGILYSGRYKVPEDIKTACDYLFEKGYISLRAKTIQYRKRNKTVIMGELKAKGVELYNDMLKYLVEHLNKE